MRVIAGKFRSRKLALLPGPEIRPTSDRLRETLFDVLTAGNPQALEGSTWLDLFAGTGAVGIEAISRGAAMVYFVESSKKAGDLIQENVQSLAVEQGFRIMRCEVARALLELERGGVRPDFIFVDPPYQSREVYSETLRDLDRLDLTSKALIVVEHEKKLDPDQEWSKMVRTRKIVQGDAALSFYRRHSD